MSKIKLLSTAVVGLLIVNLCIVGFLFLRKPPHPPGPPHLDRMGPKHKIIEMLHFDDNQVGAYEKLIDQHKASIDLLNNRIRNIKSSLYQTLNEDKGNVKDSLLYELGALQKQIETTHYDHFMEIKKLCKPDQIEYFSELTDELADFFSPAKGGPTQPR